MEYHNPKIPEHINTSREHPLKEFSTLLIATLALVVVVSLLLGVGGSWLAGKIPFSAENKVASLYDITEFTDSASRPELTAYLQSLADKISVAQKLPEEMRITAHYMDSDTVNAFATMGGNLFIYRGILEKIDNENMLVTLLAHEIGHVKYRHPIKSLGRGVAVSIAMTALTGSGSTNIMGNAGILTVLKFSRDMEKEADQEAMNTLHALYGHLSGGADLFAMFKKIRQKMKMDESPALLSTHPLDQDRIDSFKAMAAEKGWKLKGKMTPLPGFFKDSLQSKRQ